MQRPGDAWIAEAVSIARQAGSWGPTVTGANTAGLLHRLDAAIAVAPRARDRAPLHVAAAITGAVAARCARWTGDDPSVCLQAGMTHAEAAHDGPAKGQVLEQEAAVHGETARLSQLPSPQEAELAARALWEAGLSSTTSSLRCSARWRLAWEHAARGEEHAALQEAAAALVEGERGGWDTYALHTSYGEVLTRCGHHTAAQRHLSGALAAPPVSRVVILTDLALALASNGDADAAATHLEEAVHLARSCRAPGRLRGVRAVRAQLPPGRHRDQLDEVLRA